VGTVIMHNVVSVDGFIADENDEVGPLHEWYFGGDTPITEGGDQQFDHSGAGHDFPAKGTGA
jgi:hypothetical protein